jgi:DNA or RNA helicases of superfamily II
VITLRPYQDNAIRDIRNAYRSKYNAPLLVLPTGAGKTIVFTWIAANSTKRVLILVHRIELLRQTSDKLTQFGVDHGLISPKYRPQYHKRVQVASVQTLVNRMECIDNPDLIIIDEAHHATAGTWRKVLNEYNSRRLGVTATPIRTDGTGMGEVFDKIVEGPTVSDLIEGGYLTEPKIYAPKTKIDLSGVKTRGGDYAKGDLAAAMDKPTITGDAVSYYRKLADGVPAVAFCVSVDHAKHVAADFSSAGYSAEAVYGGHPDRDRVLSELGKSVDIVCSCDLISEGTDIPAIGCAILLRPTQSEALYLQQVGRALRVYPGRQYAVVLDHVGNVLRHGMPDDVRAWSLEGRERVNRAEREDAVSQCDKCYAVYPSGRICPECGHERELTQREIKQVEGELLEVKRVEKRKDQGRAKSLAALRAIERERGYKRGWAEKVFYGRKRASK